MADKKNEIAEEMPEESLEELFAKLDQVAKELESGDTSLEESFGLYQKGMEMLKLCNEKIDTVEKKDGWLMQTSGNGLNRRLPTS